MAPIFILGAGRSGTSRLASSLKRVTRLPGDPEGHFYPLASVVDEAVNTFLARTPRNNPKTTMGRLEPEAILSAYRNVVKQTLEDLYGETFLEKTPGPRGVTAMPIMLRLWPDAKLIFVKRRGIENVMSSCRKFTAPPFQWHCQNWAESMAGWTSLNPPPQQSIEVEQLFMARHPVETARALGEFLQLTDAQVEELAASFAGPRPQSTAGAEGDIISLDETEWDEEQRQRFLEVCSEQMSSYGYSLDHNYWTE